MGKTNAIYSSVRCLINLTQKLDSENYPFKNLSSFCRFTFDRLSILFLPWEANSPINISCNWFIWKYFHPKRYLGHTDMHSLLYKFRLHNLGKMKDELGRVIIACRKRCNYKQEYMAFKLGITVHSYANIEHGRVNVTTSKLMAIAELLGLKAHQILNMTENLCDGHGSG